MLRGSTHYRAIAPRALLRHIVDFLSLIIAHLDSRMRYTSGGAHLFYGLLMAALHLSTADQIRDVHTILV